MGVFDRMGNLGKGMAKVWGKQAKAVLDGRPAAPARSESHSSESALPAEDPVVKKLRTLDAMRASGTLDEVEYAQRRGEAVDGGSEPERRVADPERPLKRNL